MEKKAFPHHLMIYIEPTPYVLGLIREINQRAGNPVKVLFVRENLTQPWGLSLEGYNASVLPPERVSSAVQIYRYIAVRPTVLHLAGWGHPLMLFALMLAFLMRVPVAVESDTQLPFDLPLWKRVVKFLFYPWIFRIPAMFLPGGRRQAAYFSHYGVPAKKILPAQMTVDVGAIQEKCAELGASARAAIRQRLGLSEQKTIFIFVGRLVAHKGIADLLTAFEQVSHLDPDLALVVVGDGPEREGVDAAVRDSQAIRLTGRLDQQGVIEMFHAADVAVVPSHFEPWGLVVNEAMAAGLPVIASNRVGAVDDLVRDGETGIVFTAGDVDGLALAMITLARDRAARDRYVAAGRQLIAGWTLAESARIVLHAWQQCGKEQARL